MEEINLFKKYRKRAGYTQVEVAKLLNVTKAAVSSWESGRYGPNQTSLKALADLYGVSVDTLLGRNNDITTIYTTHVKTCNIPIVRCVRSRYDPFDETNIIGELEVGEALIKMFPKIYAIKINNDAMDPEIKISDHAIISPDTPVNDNDMGIVCVNGDDGFIKRVKRTDEGIELIPENQKYGIIKYTNEQIENIPVLICGKVIGIHRFYV